MKFYTPVPRAGAVSRARAAGQHHLRLLEGYGDKYLVGPTFSGRRLPRQLDVQAVHVGSSTKFSSSSTSFLLYSVPYQNRTKLPPPYGFVNI